MAKKEIDFKWLEENVPVEMVKEIECILRVFKKVGSKVLDIQVEEKIYEEINSHTIQVYILSNNSCHSFFYTVGHSNYVYEHMSQIHIEKFAERYKELGV